MADEEYDEENERIRLAKRTIERARAEIKKKAISVSLSEQSGEDDNDEEINQINSFFKQNENYVNRKVKVPLFSKINPIF